jgi:hypothetical protein
VTHTVLVRTIKMQLLPIPQEGGSKPSNKNRSILGHMGSQLRTLRKE